MEPRVPTCTVSPHTTARMSLPAAARPILLHHPGFQAFAGAELVTAWLLQTLGERHGDVRLHARQRIDWREVDRRFGTGLATRPPRPLRAAWSPLWIERALPAGGPMLALAREQQLLRKIHARLRPALWIGGYNETWLPAPGLIYLHHPERIRFAQVADDAPGLRARAYRAFRRRIELNLALSAPPSRSRIIANSAWTAAAYRRVGGRADQVIHPPVPPFAPGLPWDRRENRVLVLGRWAPGKRLPAAITIVAAARAAGADLRLAFAGFWHAPADERRRLLALTAGLPWVEWIERPSRAELEALAGRSRYGLHTMLREHFGIAVAELSTAGCVVLAPADGGPAEILEDPRQLYHHDDEGADLLHRLATTPALQRSLHAAAPARGLRFSPGRFRDAVHAEIAELLPAPGTS